LVTVIAAALLWLLRPLLMFSKMTVDVAKEDEHAHLCVPKTSSGLIS